ncbi:MAG: hypothetical protein PHQ23_01690, partial [Candidatus Wallbacteria bacterium]|nr:hypothetical protein [Candidatus Wallbacteria bacterium]
MKFLKTYALEIAMTLPLFIYILGFTVLPVFVNVRDSFIDERFGRRKALLETRIREIKTDMAAADGQEETRELTEEMAGAERDFAVLLSSGSGWSFSNYMKLFSDRVFRTSVSNTMIITGLGLVVQLVLAMTLA